MGLDTSAIDGFADAKDAPSLLERLNRNWRVIIPFEAADEILATPDPARRVFLLDIVRKPLAAGHIALPAAEGLKALVGRFNSGGSIDPKRFRPLVSKPDFDGLLSASPGIGAAQLHHNQEEECNFRQIFQDAAPKLKSAPGQSPPANLDELAKRHRRGRVLDSFSAELCKRAGMLDPRRGESRTSARNAQLSKLSSSR